MPEDTTPQITPTEEVPAAPPAAQDLASNPNSEGYWRRKAERATQQLEAANADRAALATEAQKATEAEARASAAEAKATRVEIAARNRIPLEALEFIPGTDEATILSNYTRLAGAFSAQTPAAAPREPVVAGTVTAPPSQQQASVQERIDSALQSGDQITAIRLMREKQGIT